MNIINNKHTEAMTKFLINRYERATYGNKLQREFSSQQSILERIRSNDSEFFA